MEAQIQYVRSADGTNIAYTVIGEGVPMIFAPNIWCHLEIQLTDDMGQAWRRMAAEGITVVPYDMRGMGMSDRDVEDFSLEAQMADIEAVRRRVGFDRFALYGNVFSSIATIAYAAKHPDRVSHLILAIPFANGAEFYQSIPTLQGLESLRTMAEGHWELYTRMHATAISPPAADPNNLAVLMRACSSPIALRGYFSELQTQDVRPLLRNIVCPTLVLSVSEGDMSLVQRRFAREVAAGIPGARMATHTIWAPASPPAKLAAEFILGHAVDWATAADVGASGARPESASGTAIILFADIADSTGLTERLGDAGFRAKARELDASLRAVIRKHAGTTIEGKLLGDGVLAVFTSARQAIEAALACGKAGDDAGLPLHLGLHAGDVIREDNNVYGGAVNIASRISGLSAPGEVLVSDIVRGLARTSAAVSFEDRGEHELKGVSESLRVWSVLRSQ